jgi:hypothetical protein
LGTQASFYPVVWLTVKALVVNTMFMPLNYTIQLTPLTSNPTFTLSTTKTLTVVNDNFVITMMPTNPLNAMDFDQSEETRRIHVMLYSSRLWHGRDRSACWTDNHSPADITGQLQLHNVVERHRRVQCVVHIRECTHHILVDGQLYGTGACVTWGK